MSGESTGSEILDQYRNTSNKLKKRFLRKPNVTEACESFAALGQHCENDEMPAYAGLCWIAAARCEGSLGNIPGETSSLIRSARQFLSAEFTNEKLGCPNPFNEDLQAALNCYAHASSRFPENSPMIIGLNLEIAQSLQKLNHESHMEQYLKNAVDLSKDSLDTKICCLNLLASNYIQTGNYTSALETFTEMSSILEKSPLNGARSETLLHSEICRVFLLLILRPAPQKLAPNLARLLEKYTWSEKDDGSLKACCMPEKLFILLQSLVLTCQSADVSSLSDLEGHFWEFLSTEQKDLLRILVKVYCY